MVAFHPGSCVHPDGCRWRERLRDLRPAVPLRPRRHQPSPTCTAPGRWRCSRRAGRHRRRRECGPRKVSFLPGMRYYAGVGHLAVVHETLGVDEGRTACRRDRQHARRPDGAVLREPGDRRAVHVHGVCLPRVQHPRPRDVHPRPSGDGRQDEADYVLTDGERITSTAIGWNFGDGHMCNEQLIAALQERCDFEPGEVRVVLIDAQPIQRQTQRYRLCRRRDRRIRAATSASPTWPTASRGTTPSQSSSTEIWHTQKREKPAIPAGFLR